MKKRISCAGVGLGVVARVVLGAAAPAMALNTGPKSCPAPRTVFTASSSAGVTEHMQNGSVRSWNNGFNIQTRFWNRGLQSVSSSSVNATLGLYPLPDPASRNYASCQL